jgi:hypothetical protein
MSHFTRNALVLLVVGITLFAYSNVDAKYYQYRVDVGQGSYNIGIYDYTVYDPLPALKRELRERSRAYERGLSSPASARYNPCLYGRCTNPNMYCINGDHFAKIPDTSKIANRIHRERQQRQRHNAEMELLEAQTALTRNLARQARQANRRPSKPHPKRLEQRTTANVGTHDALVNAIIKNVKLGRIKSSEAISYYLERTRDDQPLLDSSGSALSYINGRAARVVFIRNKLEQAGLLSKPTPTKKRRGSPIRLPSGDVVYY